MSELELRVTQALTRVRALERAVHGRQDVWEVEFADQLRARAVPRLRDNGVIFEAYVGELPSFTVLSLTYQREFMLSMPFEPEPGFDGWVSWALELDESPALR